MIQVKCIEKLRGRRNNIYGYRIVDSSGQIRDIGAERLKEYIMEGKINVVNLKLTSNNRLVDCNEKQLINTDILGKDPKITKVEKTETKKNACDAESYKEFCDLLLIMMKRYLPYEKDFIDELVETDDNGELLHRVSYLEPIYYKRLECRLEFEFYIDEKLKHGYCSWKVIDKNGDISKLPLYGKSHPLYINNIKADFNKILNMSGEIKNQLQLFNYKPKE